eukprot:gb/GFBE01052883.1/.p1 GENE.gb/GFBE01052883.1/~~gb/GFBE01052883.1/.p1  ORF type:complete len:322 (+),score=78.15 gb/GFBE01052883.1/:1-966(+)
MMKQVRVALLAYWAGVGASKVQAPTEVAASQAVVETCSGWTSCSNGRVPRSETSSPQAAQVLEPSDLNCCLESCASYQCPFGYEKISDAAVEAVLDTCCTTTTTTPAACIHTGPANNGFNAVVKCQMSVATSSNNVDAAAWSWAMTGSSGGKVTECNLYNGQVVVSNIQSGTSAKAFDNVVDSWSGGMWWEGGSQSNFRLMLVLPTASTIESVTIYMAGGGGGGKCMSCNTMSIHTFDGSSMVQSKPATSCNMNSKDSKIYKRTFDLDQPVTTSIIGFDFTLFWCDQRNAFLLQEVTFQGPAGWPSPPDEVKVTVYDRGTA